MASLIIIGSGPAGVSAALYTKRAGYDTTIISKKGGSLTKAEKIENYYGFAEAVSGEQIYGDSIKGAERIGVNFIDDEVVSLSFNGSFNVKTTGSEYTADAVLLATGVSRLAPPIKGLKDFEGRGISYCAVCDGFFFRGKKVGVLGAGEYALNEAEELLNVTESVTVFTNGEKTETEFPQGVRVVTEKISQIKGDMIINSVCLENGEEISLNGLFVAYKTAGSTALAKKVGAAVDGNRIKVNENMQTNIKGLYAAGDCTGGMLQISKAVYEGAKAATEIIRFFKDKQKIN